MKRYYLSPIIGSGSEADPYRPKVADFGVSWAGVIPSDPVTGQPLRPWCLVQVEAPDHAALLADADGLRIVRAAAGGQLPNAAAEPDRGLP